MTVSSTTVGKSKHWWTQEQKATLFTLRQQGFPYAVIAEEIGHTTAACKRMVSIIKNTGPGKQLGHRPPRIWTVKKTEDLLRLGREIMRDAGAKTISAETWEAIGLTFGCSGSACQTQFSRASSSKGMLPSAAAEATDASDSLQEPASIATRTLPSDDEEKNTSPSAAAGAADASDSPQEPVPITTRSLSSDYEELAKLLETSDN